MHNQYINSILKLLNLTFPKTSHVAKQQQCQLLENLKPMEMHACSNLSQTMYCSTSENTPINTPNLISSGHQPAQIRRAILEGFKCQSFNFHPRGSWVLLGVAVAVRRAQKKV
jgi:hypothetical protein